MITSRSLALIPTSRICRICGFAGHVGFNNHLAKPMAIPSKVNKNFQFVHDFARIVSSASPTLRPVHSNDTLRIQFAGVQKGRFNETGVSARPPIHQHPGMSTRSHAAAKLHSKNFNMEAGEELVGTTEMVEGCVVEHGELWNDDVRIHYVECGDKSGDLVILIHGFPNFWFVWKNQFRVLSEAGYHIIAPDLRGYNSSSKPKGVPNYSRKLVLSDIVCLIDKLSGGKPAMVVGHDWGGAVTWALAEDFAHRLKKVVIVNCAHGSIFFNALRSNFRQMRRSWYIGFFQLPWLPEHLMTHRNFRGLKAVLENGPCRPCSPMDVARHVVAYSKPGVPESTINYYRAAYKGFWSLEKETRPVMELAVDVLWGELDLYVGLELAVVPKAFFPNTNFKFLPQCSHFPMWDDPEQFNRLLLKSLAQKNEATTLIDQTTNAMI